MDQQPSWWKGARINWRIYYGDGTSYSNEDGDPFYAPSSNVQVVVQDGKLQRGKDAYYWKPEMGWNGCDVLGLHDYLYQYIGPKAVLLGRSIRDDDFWETVKRAGKELEMG